MFLLINQAYADVKPIEKIKRPVIRKKTHYTRSGYWVEIRYNGENERFDVAKEELPHTNYIIPTVKKGYFGYAFVDKYEFTAE